MALPRISEIGRLTQDPELRFTQGGRALLSLRLAFNSRKFNRETQEWEDGDTLFLDGALWGDKAEAVAEAGLGKGQALMVSGRLRTESWEKDGVRHSKTALLVDDVATVIRQSQAQRGKPQTDAWDLGKTDEPPF